MIYLNIYDIKIKILLFETIEEMTDKYSKLLEKYNIEQTDDNEFEGAIVENICGDRMIYILLCKPYLSYSTITHECYHATNRILAKSGVELNLEDDENHALLNGFLNWEVIKYIKSKKYRIKNG